MDGCFGAYLVQVPTGVFNVLGLRIILSRMATIWSNLGRSDRSFCQQSSMSWWRPGGQSMGDGRRYPSSIALMTFKKYIQSISLLLYVMTQNSKHPKIQNFTNSVPDLYILQCTIGALVSFHPPYRIPDMRRFYPE